VAVNAPMSAEAKKKKKEKKQAQTEQTVTINRTIYGFTLGKSTEQEVMEALTAKGFTPVKHEDGSIRVENTKVEFAGTEWEAMRIYFSQGVMFDIMFAKGFYGNYGSCEALYKTMNDKLKEKYGKIADKEMKLINFAKYDNYNDKTTCLNLGIRQIENPRSFVVVLNYYDIEMWNNYGKEVLKEI